MDKVNKYDPRLVTSVSFEWELNPIFCNDEFDCFVKMTKFDYRLMYGVFYEDNRKKGFLHLFNRGMEEINRMWFIYAANHDLYMDDISLSIIYGEGTHLDDILRSYNITKEDGVYK